MTRELEDIDVRAIALVDKAANRKKFFIIKRQHKENFTMEFKERLLKFLGKDALTEDEISKVESMDEETVGQIEKTLEVFEKYEVSEFPEDILDTVQSLVKTASLSEIKEITKEAEIEIGTFIEKAGAVFSKATKAELEKIQKIVQGLLEKAVVKYQDKEGKELDAETIAKLEELDAYKKAEKAALKKEAEEKETAGKERMEKLEKELAELKGKLKGSGVKKGLDEPDEKDEPDEDKWPSFKINEESE